MRKLTIFYKHTCFLWRLISTFIDAHLFNVFSRLEYKKKDRSFTFELFQFLKINTHQTS